MVVVAVEIAAAVVVVGVLVTSVVARWAEIT